MLAVGTQNCILQVFSSDFNELKSQEQVPVNPLLIQTFIHTLFNADILCSKLRNFLPVVNYSRVTESVCILECGRMQDLL